MVDRPSLSRILPFFVYLFFIFVADMLDRLGWGAAELRYLYPVKIAAVLAVLLACRKQYVELAGPSLNARAVALATLAGAVVLLLWINLDASWMVIGTSAGFDPSTDGRLSWPLVAVRLAGATLVVPVMEELFWRSFLMRWMVAPDFLKVNPANVKWKSFVVTVILFGFEHNLWLAGMVAGAVYGFLYMRSRDLWSSILAHGVTNGLLGIWVITFGHWTFW